MEMRSKQVRELFSLNGATIRAHAVAPDNRAIYFIPVMNEGDIWMATLGNAQR